MIFEWTVDDDRFAVYDDITRKIYYRNSLGEVLEGVRSLTPSEETAVAQQFPSLTEGQIQRKVAVLASLGEALAMLRAATADSQVSQAEFDSATPTVVAALQAYSAYPDEDPGVDKVALLVVSQIAFAYSSLLRGLSAKFITVATGYDELEQRISLIEERLDTP